MAETKQEQEKLAAALKELRDLHKLSVISDQEFERRSYLLLHPEAVPKAEEKKGPILNEELAEQLKEIRDMHKLNIISDAEYEKRTYNLLHDTKTK